MQAPTIVASWPTLEWADPGTSPSLISFSTAFSNARIRSIRR
jgi:hypothetical protein